MNSEKYTLDISGNAVEKFPKHLENNIEILSFLTDLKLSNNLFSVVPREIGECTRTKV